MAEKQPMQTDTDLEASIEQLRNYLLELIRPLIQGREIILTGSVANNVSLAEFFAEAGANKVRHLDISLKLNAPIHLQLSETEALIAKPPSSVQQFLQSIDPAGHALVYAGSFTAMSSICEREIIGARQLSHLEAERKDRQVEFLGDQMSTERYIIDLSDEDAVLQTINTWVRHAPTVVSGIPDSYIAMGSSHTYLIMNEVDNQEAYKLSNLIHSVAHDCSKAVLSTFNRGTPCTFYGYISSRWVIDFGPFKGLVYWNRKTQQVWAPGIMRPLSLNDLQSQAARSAVYYVAQHLYEKTGYTGAFCTDGVMQADGYIIHEINPRICAGFSLLGELCGGKIPFTLIDLVLRTHRSEADNALFTPLSKLATLLQTQKRLLKLWDPNLKPLQEEMRSRIDETNDNAAWITEVKQSLVDSVHIPLEDL